MSNFPTFDVHASVQPDGRAERVNTLDHRTFYTIHKMFKDHQHWRWLVVRKTNMPVYHVVDLWQTKLLNDFPYEDPFFSPEAFDSVDQAIGFIALHLT